MKRNKIFICNTEDKKEKIYFDIESNKFGSIEKKSSIGSSVLISFSIIGYVILRNFQNYKLPEDRKNLFFLFVGLGIFVGFCIAIFKNRLAKDIHLSYQTISKEEREKYISNGKNQLDMQKAGIFFLIVLILVNTVLFFLDNEIVTLVVISLSFMLIIVFANYLDIFRRKKIYKDLIEENEMDKKS